MATAPVINIPKDTPPEMAQNMMGIVKSIRDISFKSQKVSFYQVDGLADANYIGTSWQDVTDLRLNISLKKSGFIFALTSFDAVQPVIGFYFYVRLCINGSPVANSVRESIGPAAYTGNNSTHHAFRAGAGPIEVKVQTLTDANGFTMAGRALTLIVVEDA